MAFYIVCDDLSHGGMIDSFVRAATPSDAIQMFYDYWNGEGALFEGEAIAHEVPLVPNADGVIPWEELQSFRYNAAVQSASDEIDGLTQEH